MKGQGGAGCWWWRHDRDLLARGAAPTHLAGRQRGSLRTWRRVVRQAGALHPMKRASLRAIASGFWAGRGPRGGPGPLWVFPAPKSGYIRRQAGSSR